MKFYSGALRVLDRLLRLDGATVSIDQIDTTSPITPVLDVARLVSLNGVGPEYNYLTRTIVNTHAVIGGVIVGTFDLGPTNGIWTALGVPPATHWLWLIEATCYCATSLTITGPTLLSLNAPLVPNRTLLNLWDSTTADAVDTNIKALFTTAGADKVQRPRLMPDDAVLRLSTSFSGAIADVTCSLLFFCCPKGTHPPGMS